jgi:hypothetical protein
MVSNYAIKLISADNFITLPETIKNIKKIKVKKIYYRFINLNQNILTVNFLNYDKNTYFDGITTNNYTSIFYNDGNLNVKHTYGYYDIEYLWLFNLVIYN